MSLDLLLSQYSAGESIKPMPQDQQKLPESPYFRSPPIYQDPRPDLIEDHEHWNALLEIALHFHKENSAKSVEFCATLNYFRCGGTRIRPGKNGWVLRPDIDETGRKAWSSQAEYDELKEKHLTPWMDWLKLALKRLGEKVPFKPQ